MSLVARTVAHVVAIVVQALESASRWERVAAQNIGHVATHAYGDGKAACPYAKARQRVYLAMLASHGRSFGHRDQRGSHMYAGL